MDTVGWQGHAHSTDGACGDDVVLVLVGSVTSYMQMDTCSLMMSLGKQFTQHLQIGIGSEGTPPGNPPYTYRVQT